jgi:hypothetical protein
MALPSVALASKHNGIFERYWFTKKRILRAQKNAETFWNLYNGISEQEYESEA